MTHDDDSNPFDGPQLQDAHYIRADMSGSNFDGVNLTAAKFFAVLEKATFRDTNLRAADFDDVNLSEARFNNINLSGTSITYANMSGLTISGVTLAETHITDADLRGMRINGILVTDLFAAYENAQS